MKKAASLLSFILIMAFPFLNISLAYAQGITIGAGGNFNLNNGTLTVPGDIVINGTLRVSTGTIIVGGDWIKNGTFTTGTGTVRFIDGQSPARITGESLFYNLIAEITDSNKGKELNFESGKTQTITNELTLLGIDNNNRLLLRSTNVVQQAMINLQPGGSQTINYVDVQNHNATGEHLAPGPATSYNSADSGNNTRWFQNDYNQTPTADDQSVITQENQAVDITLTANDSDGDPLIFSVVTNPSNGNLSGTAPNLIYTPGDDYNGSDSFTFKVNDGSVDSNIAMVSITIDPVNDPPIVSDITDVSFDRVGNGTLPGNSSLDDYVSDVETLDADIIWAVNGGNKVAATINPDRTVTFSALTDFSGQDILTFTATDTGDGTSGPLSDNDQVVVTVYCSTSTGIDSDCDGTADIEDNCPSDPNPDQSNLDNQDGGDVCDVCPSDVTDTCDPGRSGGDTIGPDGGTIATPDGSVVIEIPPGALDIETSISITDSGNGVAYELTTNLGKGTVLFGVNIQPEGITFNVPVTITFFWQDADNDGWIDGRNVKEGTVRLTKNNNVVTDMCQKEPGPLSDTAPECDPDSNYFSIQTTSFSNWAIWVLEEIIISNAPSGDQRYPWVDYNPDTGEYLVLWQDRRSGVNDDIYGVLLDQDGIRIGSDFAVSTASGHQQRVLVKSGGGGYLALWHDLRNYSTNGADIYGAWIDGSGTVGPEMVICACAQHQWNPVAGYDPVSNTFLVVFLSGTGSGTGNDVYDLWGAVIPAGGTGSVSPFPMVTETGAQRGPQIGYDYGNNQYYMAWNDRRGSNYDIYGSRVTTSGTLLDRTGVLLSGATGNQFRPTVTDRRPVSGINNHLVGWTDYRPGTQADIYGVYVDGNGAIVGSEIPISTHANNEANVVADVDWINTKQSLVGYIRQRTGESYYLIKSASVDQNGLFTNHGSVNTTTYEQRAEVVSYATNGASDYGFLLVWMDQRNGTDYDIWGKKVWPSTIIPPETCHVSSDTQIQDALISFVAEGRIGDLAGAATFEIDIGQSTASPAQTAQFEWPNGMAVPFTLTYDRISNLVSFIIGGNTLTYSPTLTFSEIFIRTRAVNIDTGISVDNLILDNGSVDGSVGDISFIAGPYGLDILWINAELFSEDFTLEGNATMSWVGTPPTQSNLAFQIMVGMRNGTCPSNP